MSNIPAAVNGLPPYGNWGGPGWSAGQVITGGPLTPDQIKVKPTDSLDALFKAHDLAYDYAQYSVTDPATLKPKGGSITLISEQPCHVALA